MKLSPHFTLEEMTYSSTAAKYHIENKPSQRTTNELTRLCNELLESIRMKWNSPIIVSSGYRCPELNRKIGGAKNSQHIYGTAADIKPKEGTVKELFECIKSMIDNNEITVRQLIDEYNYSWVHVSVNDKWHGYKNNQIIHLK